MSRSVVVVGGGLAGLVAARHLAEGGADVTVYEQRETVGGRVRSRRRKGCLLDVGFQVLLTAYPAVRRELDLEALDLRPFKPRAVIARPGQRSVLSDPLRDPTAAVDSLTNSEVSFTDKLRTLALRQDLSTRSYGTLHPRSSTTGTTVPSHNGAAPHRSTRTPSSTTASAGRRRWRCSSGPEETTRAVRSDPLNSPECLHAGRGHVLASVPRADTAPSRCPC